MGPAAFLPFVILPSAALLLRPWLPPWGFMWVMAAALYAGCKWLTFSQAYPSPMSVGRSRAVGYLLAWPGMDAVTFLSQRHRVDSPATFEWIAAVLKTGLGLTLTWVLTRRLLPAHPLLAGWSGMAGLVFVLHFGTFHLLSLLWRRLGVAAVPLMRNPLRSTSLAEFWGRRWNTAFHELAVQYTFRPLRTPFGLTAATLLAFLASGLIHELVISVPARGGYGLPTGYFVLQGLGLVAERRFGPWLGSGRGLRGWLFTMSVAAGPVFWLFHPPFVRNVMLPMLGAIGAV